MARTSKIINTVKNEIQHYISWRAQWCSYEKPIEVGRERGRVTSKNPFQAERYIVDKNKGKRINIRLLADIQSVIRNKWPQRDIKKQGHR